jgi:Fur family transcriptional regulator, ferric uptake regulator
LSEAEKILQHKKLKKTQVRKEVLEVFLKHNYALSHADIEEILSEVDKVTLYRTLNIFEENGIIHVAQTNTDAKQYAICKENCSTDQHEHNHIHFFCKKCEKTFCIPEELEHHNKLPKGYKAEEMIVLVKGLCDACNA